MLTFIFSFSVDLLKVLGGEIESAVNCYVIKCVQPFLLRLTLEDNFVSVNNLNTNKLSQSSSHDVILEHLRL